MIETIMVIIKASLLLVAVISIARLAYGIDNGHKFIFFFGITMFVSGMEMITTSETPWSFLLFEGTTTDWNNALLGGVGFLALPLMLYAVVGKDVQKLLDKKIDS